MGVYDYTAQNSANWTFTPDNVQDVDFACRILTYSRAVDGGHPFYHTPKYSPVSDTMAGNKKKQQKKKQQAKAANANAAADAADHVEV